MTAIVHETEPVALVGGAQATTADIHKALTLSCRVVAADGGAAQALAAGADVAAVIGDFDSVDQAALNAIPSARHHTVTEQDSTDFEKALGRIDAPVVLGAGFMGGRIDHQLAVCHGLLRFADRPCILLNGAEIMLLAPPDICVPTEVGDVVSLFPLVKVTGKSSGLQWPIEGLTFAPGQFIGTSNVATGPCRLSMDAPGMLLVLPAATTQPVVAALSDASFVRWPAL